MPRSHFINPYTFIPLAENGPLITEYNQSSHAWFEEETFTGKIRCKLVLLTPTIIPGCQKAGTTSDPGNIKTYTHNGRLAIPGSRLRGHILNLMRAINSSPVTAFERRVILDRRTGNPQKGILLEKKNGWYIQEVGEEVLVAHPDRIGSPHLQGNCHLEYRPVAFDAAGAGKDIPDFDPGLSLPTQGITGDLYWQNPMWGPTPLRPHKFYLAKQGHGHLPKPKRGGRWVKLLSWSGQDGENQLKDFTNHRMVHRNAWHLVNLKRLGKKIPVSNSVLEAYTGCVDEMASLIEERDSSDRPHAIKTRMAKELSSGTFVYFKHDGNGNAASIGRHYHYLELKGIVEEKVANANLSMANYSNERCVVTNLSGWANEGDDPGMKGRIWVEMAIGPKRENALINTRNLRILSSQPPKAACFYLENGDYQDPHSTIRGRKFYWHDPYWNRPMPMWDNQDLNTGEYAFDNPEPGQNQKQWAEAETIMASGTDPVMFKFSIRLLNATSHELYLLLTALVGLSATIEKNGRLQSENLTDWCHKIGHARPFMGSGIIVINRIEKLSFDQQTYLPMLTPEDLSIIADNLKKWQAQTLEGDHIPMLKRVMHPEGAYQSGENPNVPITYPYAFSDQRTLSWRDPRRKNHPKTFHWFSNNKIGRGYKMKLPKPEPGTSQALPVIPVASNNRHENQTVYKSSSEKGGAMEDAMATAFKNAKKKK